MADAVGLGSDQEPLQTSIAAQNRAEVISTRDETQAVGAGVGHSAGHDPVEIALADALTKAAAAGRYELVGQLARELEARRLAREEATNVIPIAKGKRA